MQHVVSVELPNRPSGEPVEVQGVGVVENYGTITTELTDEQVESINESYGLSATPVTGPPPQEEEVKEGGDDE